MADPGGDWDKDGPDPGRAEIIPLRPRTQLDDEVKALLSLTQLADFPDDHEQQAQAFIKMRQLWAQLTPQHHAAIKAATCNALKLSDARFSYLMKLDDLVELRQGLAFQPDRDYQRDPDEDFYPTDDSWLGRYLKYACPGSVHVGWHFWAGLVVLASACRRNFYLLTGHKKFFPNLYVILEGPSGFGKNTASERAVQLLRIMNDQIAYQAKTQGIGNNSPGVYVFPNKMTARPFLTALTGGARRLLVMKAEQQPQDYETCGLVFAEEMVTLFGEAQYGADQMIALLTQAYDGRVDDSTDKHGDIALVNVTLSGLFGTTAQWLRDKMTASVFQGGFLGARVLLICKGMTQRATLYPWEPVVDPIERASLTDELRQYTDHAPVEMKISPGADRLYREWFVRHAVEFHEDDRIQGYFTRRKVYILKLAMLIALSRGHCPTIQEEDMDYAAKLLAHEEPALLDAFQSVLTTDEATFADQIMRILKISGGHCTVNEIWHRLKHRMSREEIQDTLVTLKQMGEVGERKWKALSGRFYPMLYRMDMEDENGNLILQRDKHLAKSEQAALLKARENEADVAAHVVPDLPLGELDVPGHFESLEPSEIEDLSAPASDPHETVEPGDS